MQNTPILFNNRTIGEYLINYYSIDENNIIASVNMTKIQPYEYMNWELKYESMQQFVNQLLIIYTIGNSYQVHISIANLQIDELLNVLPNNIKIAVVYENNLPTSFVICDTNVTLINAIDSFGIYGLNYYVANNSPNCRVKCYNGFTLNNSINTLCITTISDEPDRSINWSFVNNEYIPFVYTHIRFLTDCTVSDIQPNIIYKYLHTQNGQITILEMFNIISNFILLPPGTYMCSSNNPYVNQLHPYLTSNLNNSIYFYNI
jgi:hypothetical protein